MRGMGQFRRLQYTISILRVHVARQCGATDSVEEVREIRVAESGGAVQMERKNLRIGLWRRQSGKEQGAREAAWMLAKSVLKLKEKNESSNILLTFGK